MKWLVALLLLSGCPGPWPTAGPECVLTEVARLPLTVEANVPVIDVTINGQAVRP